MHLTLFFTHKTSLERWNGTGMFDREVALYRKYLEMGAEIAFVTYGKNDRLLFGKQLAGIEILCNDRRLPTRLYTALLPLLHAGTLRSTDVIKTNQTPGGLVALRSSKLFGKPLLARCGYMHSDFEKNRHGAGSNEATRALREENRLFSGATEIAVTTAAMRKSILSRMPDTLHKTAVIPNYVDTGLFSPSEVHQDIDLLFIGRLVPQKNLSSLLDALRGLALRTVIIGSGTLERELREKAHSLGLEVDWKKSVPNHELPFYLNRSKAFILPSLYEGHPKTLIEAMACGRPVIGANSPGIREIVRDGETGCFCGTSPESIRAAVERLISSRELRRALGENARNFAVGNYSLDRIARQEFDLLGRLAAGNDRK